MRLLDENSAVLQLEETLLILEESLQYNVFHHSLEKHYIQRLKQLYSPQFDIEHSETGSYYYATLECIRIFYLVEDSLYKIPMSAKFKTSILHLLDINSHALDSKKYQNRITEQLLALSELWQLQNTLDIADLLASCLSKMRLNLMHTFEKTL